MNDNVLIIACRVMCPPSAGESVGAVRYSFVSSGQQRSVVVGRRNTCSTKDALGKLCTTAISDTGCCRHFILLEVGKCLSADTPSEDEL